MTFINALRKLLSGCVNKALIFTAAIAAVFFHIVLLTPFIIVMNIFTAWLAALTSCLSLHSVTNWLYNRILFFGVSPPINITSPLFAIKMAAHVTVDSLLLMPFRAIIQFSLIAKMYFDLMTLRRPELKYDVFVRNENILELNESKFKSYVGNLSESIIKEVSFPGMYNTAKRNCMFFCYTNQQNVSEADVPAPHSRCGLKCSNS